MPQGQSNEQSTLRYCLSFGHYDLPSRISSTWLK
nr:MAG TPA: E2 early protein-like protein [Caudoviricetes sp.]